MILTILVVDIALNAVLVPIYGLTGAAFATTLSGIFGIVLSGTYVYRHFHILTNLRSIIRITVVSLVIYLFTRILPVSGMLLIAYYAGLLALYFILLFVFREIKEEDINVAKGLFSRLSKTE